MTISSISAAPAGLRASKATSIPATISASSWLTGG